MKNALLFLVAFLVIVWGLYIAIVMLFANSSDYRQWDFQSIDTMKYSRDMARSAVKDPHFDDEIDRQMKDIAATGATHVAIGTPYDEEFIPYMKKWVKTARKYKLHVWFRGNFSGWEEWFKYPKIDKAEHLAKTKDFIVNNPDIFEDGDIFTSCTECENGSPVEYGNASQIQAHREFILKEYAIAKEGFATIHKDVKANYYSMNGDLARAMMDKETTAALDGVVVIDHYVSDPKTLSTDIREIAKQSGGTVILGEFGAPIPDIHGKMTEEEQKQWIQEALHEIAAIPQLGGINYWVNKDSSTAIWAKTGKPRSAVQVLTQYFKGKMHVIKVSD